MCAVDLHVHIYTDHLPLGQSRDDLTRRILAGIVRYLRNGYGRSDIALWTYAVENTAWLGGHPQLWPGSSIVYAFSRN